MHLWKMELPVTPFRNQKIVEGCLAWQVGTGGQLRIIKSGSLTPFKNQKLVEGCFAWQVGTGGQLRMRQECGRRWLGKDRQNG